MAYAESAPSEGGKKGKAGKLSDDDLKVMRKRHQHGVDRDEENRTHAREDLGFRSGDAQWDDGERKKREGLGRPTLSFNKSGAFIRQVTGDVRQNKPAIKVSPAGEGSRKEIAEAYAGLIRNIEQQSNAPYIYSQAADNSVTCGIGWFRITTDYSSDDSFEQDIRLKGIPNPLSVIDDPDAMELDRTDAMWRFVYSDIATDTFKEMYPKARVIEFEKLDTNERNEYGDWCRKDVMRIAEYWCKKPVTRTLLLLSDGQTCFEDEYTPEKFGTATPVNKRTVKTFKVWQHIVSGAEELEEPREWAGKFIPIIPVIGEEIWVDEKCVRKGLIRDAKDAMRAYNYARSTSIEVVALQPKAPITGTAAMFEGLEEFWKNAGNTALPYLPFNPDPTAPTLRPERLAPPIPATGLMAEAEQANRDIQSTIGIYDPQLGAKSNETSGRAIMAREQQGDTGTFVWIDNLSLAIATAGRMLIDLIPKIYDTRRVVRVLSDDGQDQTITINHPVMGADDQQRIAHDPMKGFYDLTIGKYDITVQAGPSFATKREQAATGMLELMKIFPNAAPILAPRLAKTQDWDKADEVAEDLNALLPPQLQKPKMGPDGQPIEQPPPPPPPEVIAEQAKIAAMKDKQVAEQEAQQAKLALQAEEQRFQQQLAAQNQAFEQQLATQKVQFEMELAAFQAGERKRLADEEMSAKQKREAMPQEMLMERIGDIVGGMTNDILTKAKPPRRGLRTWRDAQDNLQAEEYEIPDEMMQVEGSA